MLKRVVILFFSVTITGYSFSQITAYSNDFLSIGVGARALGMSGATVATVSDATSGYWNPAGLLNIKSNLEIALMHSGYFAGMLKYDYGAAAIQTSSSNIIGLSVIRLAVDNIPNTTELLDANGNFNYDNIKSFSVADYGVLFSYARKTSAKGGISWGLNAKIIHRTAGDFAGSWGFGADAGIQYQVNKWKFGAMGKDITTTFNAWSFNLSDKMKEVFSKTGNEIPVSSVEITMPRIIAGAAYEIKINKKTSVTPELNLDFTFDGKRNVLLKSKIINVDPHIGIEAGYNDFLFLRCGISNIQDVKDLDGKKIKIIQPNMGVGIKLGRLLIDYALTNIGSQGGLLYSNVFSLNLNIYKQTRRRR